MATGKKDMSAFWKGVSSCFDIFPKHDVKVTKYLDAQVKPYTSKLTDAYKALGTSKSALDAYKALGTSKAALDAYKSLGTSKAALDAMASVRISSNPVRTIDASKITNDAWVAVGESLRYSLLKSKLNLLSSKSNQLKFDYGKRATKTIG